MAKTNAAPSITVDHSNRWFMVSLAVGVTVAVCTALLIALPIGWVTATALSFLIAVIWVLFRNPRYWYRRAAGGLISALVMLPIIETFSLQLHTASLTLAWSASTSLTLYVVTAALVAYLLFLDFRSNQGHIRSMPSALGYAEYVEDKSEQIKIVESVTKARGNELSLSAFQARSGFLDANTESLPPAEKRAVILRQIELREQQLLAQHRQRMTVIVAVSFWIIGVSAVVSYKLVAGT